MTTTSSSDAERSKPDPDIVRVAVDKAGVGPARCVMLGDTPYDVEAATRARRADRRACGVAAGVTMSCVARRRSTTIRRRCWRGMTSR